VTLPVGLNGLPYKLLLQGAYADLLLCSGDWLLLKNLHLVVSWLPALEKEVHSIGPGRHPGFRLFLASQPHARFPATLLERSIKVWHTRESATTVLDNSCT